MVYTNTFKNGILESICTINLHRIRFATPRLLSIDALIKASNIFLLILVTLDIGNSRAATDPNYYEPGINPYREQASQDGLESIDPYTGMLKVRHLDLYLPGNGGLDIKVLRTYDSANVFRK